MSIYKVKGNITVEIEKDIEADSKEKAKNIFYEQDATDLFDSANYIEEIDSTVKEINLAEGTFLVNVNYVEYDVGLNDVWDLVEEEHPGIDTDSKEFDKFAEAKMDEIYESLPQEFDFEIDCEEKYLEDYIYDLIFEKTGYSPEYFKYTIKGIK